MFICFEYTLDEIDIEILLKLDLKEPFKYYLNIHIANSRLVIFTANLLASCIPPVYTKFIISKVKAIIQGMPLVELASKQMSKPALLICTANLVKLWVPFPPLSAPALAHCGSM